MIDLPTYREKKEKGNKVPFTRIINTSLQDNRLSWKARGLLGYMLSHSDDFKFHLDKLAEEAPDGLDSVKAGIKELEKLGYVKRYPTKVKGKIVAWNMDVYEKPQVDLPLVEKPLEENPTLITNKLITNNLNNNKELKDYIDLTIDDDSYLTIYNKYFKAKFNKDHMQVTEEQMSSIKSQISKIDSYDICIEDWEEVVEEHFDNLPKKNNGNIIAFLHASSRHFEVPYYD